jgi:hypothetical protein
MTTEANFRYIKPIHGRLTPPVYPPAPGQPPDLLGALRAQLDANTAALYALATAIQGIVATEQQELDYRQGFRQPVTYQDFDMTAAHTDLLVTFPPCRWIKATSDGSLAGIAIKLSTQSEQSINVADFSAIAVINATRLYLTNDVIAGRTKLRLTFSLMEPIHGTSIDIPSALLISQYTRWGRVITVSWVHAVEVVAPLIGATLVTKAVGAGKSGYIYGFFISAGEANNFLINWTSGGVAKSKRIVFSALGSVEAIDTVPLNEGLPADPATNVTITNVTAAGAGIVYQANLLYGEL